MSSPKVAMPAADVKPRSKVIAQHAQALFSDGAARARAGGTGSDRPRCRPGLSIALNADNFGDWCALRVNASR